MIWAFFISAALTLGGAAVAVSAKRLTASATAMAVSFLGAAGLFVVIGAEMLAVFQVLVYLGAIAVLIVFAVVLTGQRPADERPNRTRRLQAALLAGLTGGIAVWSGFLFIGSGSGLFGPRNGALADALFGPLALPFELTSALLLAAIIGGIFLGAGGDER